MGYSHITWACPFFTWDEKRAVHCEAGVIRFPDRTSIQDYSRAYCANVEQWHGCSLAAALLAHYDRKDGDGGETPS